MDDMGNAEIKFLCIAFAFDSLICPWHGSNVYAVL